MKIPIKRLSLLLGVIAFLAGGLSSVLAMRYVPAPVSEAEYWNLVDESRRAAAELKGKTEDEVKAGLAVLLSKWQPAPSVRLGDGQVVQLDSSHIVSTLTDQKTDIDRILKIFDALQEAHQKYPSQVFTTESLVPLREILSRPEFRWQKAGANPVNDFFNWLWNKFRELLGKLFGNRDGVIEIDLSPLYFLAIIALTVVLFLVLRTVFRDFLSEVRVADENAGEELLTAEAAFAKAQNLSRGGDYRTAVRFLYLSSLLLLDERGLLRYDRSKTNREYLRSVSSSPELQQPLSEVIEVFDDVWYGYHQVDEEKFKHYSDRVEELKERKS
ncbi:MAG: DUF4129 domain-containing protein [Chloroflexi bacterium]|nr:DUF4129 domain-containing protein [Chloroflexota bacterium]